MPFSRQKLIIWNGQSWNSRKASPSFHPYTIRVDKRGKESLWFYLFAINVKEKYNILTIQDGLFPSSYMLYLLVKCGIMQWWKLVMPFTYWVKGGLSLFTLFIWEFLLLHNVMTMRSNEQNLWLLSVLSTFVSHSIINEWTAFIYQFSYHSQC